jgi:CRP-like cAMP-binding protein
VDVRDDVILGPFADLAAPARGALLSTARVARFSGGELVFRKGDPAEHVAVVQSGLIAVQGSDRDGRALTLAVLGTEEIVGELALAGVPRRTATIVALQEAALLLIDVRRLRTLRSSALEVDEAVMAVLADTVRRLTDQLIEATLLTQPLRLRRILLRLHRHYEDGRIALTHQELADILGARRTTVTELLTADASAGLIETGRGYVRILDEPRLRAAAV